MKHRELLQEQRRSQWQTLAKTKDSVYHCASAATRDLAVVFTRPLVAATHQMASTFQVKGSINSCLLLLVKCISCFTHERSATEKFHKQKWDEIDWDRVELGSWASCGDVAVLCCRLTLELLFLDDWTTSRFSSLSPLISGSCYSSLLFSFPSCSLPSSSPGRWITVTLRLLSAGTARGSTRWFPFILVYQTADTLSRRHSSETTHRVRMSMFNLLFNTNIALLCTALLPLATF